MKPSKFRKPRQQKIAAPHYPHRYEVLQIHKGQPLWMVRLALSEAEERRAGELGLSAVEFLEAFVNRSLPGQVGRRDDHRPEVETGSFRFEALYPKLAARLERAAKEEKVSVAELLARAIGGDLNSLEEITVLHPVSGDYLACDWEIEKWQLSKRWVGPDPAWALAGPKGVKLFERGEQLKEVGAR